MGIKKVWKDIPGYNGAYQASTKGEIASYRYNSTTRRKTPRLLHPYTKKDDRVLFVRLTDDNGKTKEVRLTTIMANTFMGGKKPGHVIYHKNGSLSDCELINLGQITRQDLGKLTGANSTRKPVKKIDCAGNVVTVYRSAKDAARENYISHNAILDRCYQRVEDPFRLDGFNYLFDD